MAKNRSLKKNYQLDGWYNLLAVAFSVHFFLMSNLGPWSAPTIANHMFIKAIISQMLLTALLVYMQWKIFSESKLVNQWQFSWPVVFFAAFFIWASASVFWAVNRDFFVFKWMMLLTAAIAFYVCIRFDEKRWDIVFKAIIFSGLVTAILSFAQVYFNFKGMPQVSVPAATFGNKNMMGQFMVLASSLCFYYFCRAKVNSKMQYLYIATSFLMLLALFHGQARATWLAQIFTAVFIAGFLIFNRKKISSMIIWSRQKTAAVIIGLMLFAVTSSFVNVKDELVYKPFYGAFTERMNSITTAAAKTEGADVYVRYMIWRACLNMIEDKPLMGSGLGGFFDNMLNGYKNYRSMRTFRAHNDLLEYIAEVGIIGLLFLVIGMLGVLLAYISLLKKVDAKQQFLLTCIIAVIGGNLINSMFSFPYQLTLPQMMMAMFFAYILSVAHQHQIFEMRTIAISSFTKSIALSCAVVVMLFVWFVNVEWWGGYNRINKAMKDGSKPFKTETWIFNQEQVPIIWAVGDALYTRWPYEYVTLDMHYKSLMALGQTQQALILAERGLESAKQGLYGFYQKLFNFYLSQKNYAKAKEIMERLANVDDKYLALNNGGFDQLILMSMKLRIDPKPYYEKMQRVSEPNINTENNMVIYYLSIKDRDNATIHIKKLLEINPNHRNAKSFKNYLDNPNSQINVNI